MREIKFRGRTINGEWVYGNLLKLSDGYLIIPIFNEFNEVPDNSTPSPLMFYENEFYVVDPNTVGQFTGLHDKNGKEIYERDIIRTYDSKDDEIKHTVEYSDKEAMFCTKLIGADMLGGSITQRWLDEFEFEVIGNVYDNMELLKGGEE